MKESVLLNVIGHPGAGKSEVCKRLKDQWGFEIYSPSGLIRDFANRKGLTPKGREDFSRCHELMIDADPLAFMRPILGRGVLRLCADGLRSPLDAQRLKNFGGHIISLTASRETRYDRVTRDSERTASRAPLSFEKFCDDEMADNHTDPRLTNTQAVIDIADFNIDTDYLSMQEVISRIDAITADLLEPKSHTPSPS